MPLSPREEDEVAAVIAETGVGMAQAHTIINALEEAGWVIDLLDPGPGWDKEAETQLGSDPLGDFIVEDASKLWDNPPHDYYDVAFQPIRTRW